MSALHFCIGLALTLVSTSIATADSWKLDAAHSQVLFSVNHLVISEVTGSFREFDATLESASEDFTDARIGATLKASSIDTDNEGRDKELRASGFFDVEKFPEIRFVGTSIQKTGSDTYAVTGLLTIRDSTKAVVLDTRYKGSVKDPWGNIKAGFKATATINRFDYGLKWNAVMETGQLVVGEAVQITLLLEFTRGE